MVSPNSEERVQWVYASTNNQELEERYDQWASAYDKDLEDDYAWNAPHNAGKVFAELVPEYVTVLGVADNVEPPIVMLGIAVGADSEELAKIMEACQGHAELLKGRRVLLTAREDEADLNESVAPSKPGLGLPPVVDRVEQPFAGPFVPSVTPSPLAAPVSWGSPLRMICTPGANRPGEGSEHEEGDNGEDRHQIQFLGIRKLQVYI